MTYPHPPHILCINPWIHDFAAYDVWAKPLGLLSLATALRSQDFSVSYIDCLDRFHPSARSSADPFVRGGRGPYRKTRIPTPFPIRDVPRNFSRYGIDREWFKADLLSAEKPDLVFVTSLMTYWYTGVAETIEAVKEVYPDVPVILGGIYATLCPDHARSIPGVAEVITGPGEPALFQLVEKYTGAKRDPGFDIADPDEYPYPALDLQHKIGYVPLLTARGCPYRCAYCASHLLQPKRLVRKPETITAEISWWNKRFGVADFVFYDDALLVDAESHAIPMLEAVCALRADLSFHTPNALHVRNISSKTAELMRKAGFKTVRLGLETTDFHSRKSLDAKVREEEFLEAAARLREAGFDHRQVGAYLLAGLPGQEVASVEESIDTVKNSGITPILAFYSPIPGTSMWDAACAASRYDLYSDPLFTNNALMPCWPEFDWQTISRLKQRIVS